MTKYETLFLCKPELPEETIQGMVKRLSDQVEANQGKLAAVDMWGNRRLAYPVSYRGSKYVKGFYILFTYLGGGQTVAEIERTIGLLEDIMRSQTVKLEEGVDPATITEVAHSRQRDEVITPEAVFVKEEDEGEPLAPVAPVAVDAGPAAAAPAGTGGEPQPAPVEPAPVVKGGEEDGR